MNRHVGLVIGQLGFGGAERQLAYLARGLKEKGEPVSVFCLSQELVPWGEEIKKAGIPLFSIRRGGHRELSRVIRLAGLLRREKIDLVHSFLEVGNIYSFLALPLTASPLFIPSVRNMLLSWGTLKRILHGRALKAGDTVIANCRAAAAAYAGVHNLDPRIFHVIHNGVPVCPLLDNETRLKARKCFRIPEAAKVIGTVSRDTPVKNISAFLDLVGELSRKTDNICALVAGSGLDESYGSRLKHTLTSTCPAVFLGQVRDMASFYAALDVFVLTSLVEGLPNSILEAMAAGLPVAAYNVGGVGDLVEDRVTGFLVPAGDEKRLFEAGRALLGDEELARMMGQAGRKKVVENFSVEKMVSSTLALYEEVRARKG